MASLTQWTWVWASFGRWWREAWRAAVHDGITKSWTWLSNWTELTLNAMLQCYRMVCKGWSTFLHTVLAHVAHICTIKNVTFPTLLRINCHNSSIQMPVTSCNLIGKALYSLYELPNGQTQTQSLWSPCPVVTQSSLLHVITGQYHVVLVHLHEII